MESPEVYDLLILVDATYSMNDYLQSLQISLPKIIALSALTDCFSRIGLLAYRDYCDDQLLEWSGWLQPSAIDSNKAQPDLIEMSKKLEADGGGDHPEAVKTGLAKAYEEMRADATTIILLYTDAPPHSRNNGSMVDSSSNLPKEKKALSDAASYGGYGPNFADWVSASQALHNGEKKAQVFCILQLSFAWQSLGFYNYLSTITRGSCMTLKNSAPHSISEVTVQLLLAWMGVEKSGTPGPTSFPASMSRYISVKNIKSLKDEEDPAADRFFPAELMGRDAENAIKANIAETSLTQEVLKKHLPKKTTPVQDFAKQYATDEAYKTVAIEHLRKIVALDVSAVSLNPVFGSLWRAVCNDRENPARDGLIQDFGYHVDRISDTVEQARMKAWLEESYDYTAEVTEAIEKIPVSERFPCVLLDPTIKFETPPREDDEDEEDSDNRPITEFRRDELLEIGRSCDYKILRRLGRILTRLTFVNSAEELPAHIARTTDEEVPRVPMALTSREYGQKFWKILLHIVVPGTMLSARPAALLAALSIRLGIQPLLEPGVTEMLRWKDKWNNLSSPETWNLSCLSLLLDADKAYQETVSNPDGHETSGSSDTLLNEGDRELFSQLVAYKLLEINLHTPLTALVGFTPDKTSVPIGPLAVCRSCHYPRSVTIMAKNGKCGHCIADDYVSSGRSREECIKNRVTQEDKEETLATWVECCVQSCRAQYVVYNLENLNVRSKCYYCRAKDAGPAPAVECKKCLNRVIWPLEYRPRGFSTVDYNCPGCEVGHKTTVENVTTAAYLKPENGISWLLKSTCNSPTFTPFNNRNLYHTITTVTPESFMKHITLFPSATPSLTLKGKPLHNSPALLSSLRAATSLRHRPTTPCSLCFTPLPPSTLLPACARKACHQRLCNRCLRSWYGINTPGAIINTAALFCPFCRRKPSARTMAKYGGGIHAVGGLEKAVEERGEWVHAWCLECGMAKRLVERTCARGMGVDVKEWVCEGCEVVMEEMERADEDAVNALLAEQEADDEAIAAARLGGVNLGGNRANRGDRAGYVDTRTVKRVPRLPTKKCPGCGILTQKVWGCNHMMCPVSKCGTHWCWACGRKDLSAAGIYGHISSVHGGLYGNGDDGVEDVDVVNEEELFRQLGIE